jgi:DNA-directed RNA polymerase specialized sigma24 family protein
VTGSLDVFDRHRRLLFSVAYQMLGSVADAEDVVQDTWLRWSAADRSAVADERAYLVQITTRLALDRLGSARARRESYVGPWLPEPLLTRGAAVGSGPPAPEPEDAVELGEMVSLALFVVLETLSLAERAAFVLREVFGMPVARWLVAIAQQGASIPDLRIEVAEVNGWPAIVGWAGMEPFGSISLALAEGRIEQVLVVVNPDKLAGLVLP